MEHRKAAYAHVRLKFAGAAGGWSKTPFPVKKSQLKEGNTPCPPPGRSRLTVRQLLAAQRALAVRSTFKGCLDAR